MKVHEHSFFSFQVCVQTYIYMQSQNLFNYRIQPVKHVLVTLWSVAEQVNDRLLYSLFFKYR